MYSRLFMASFHAEYIYHYRKLKEDRKEKKKDLFYNHFKNKKAFQKKLCVQDLA